MLEKAKAEFRPRAVEDEERAEPAARLCAGGKQDGATVTVSAGMPIGARTVLSGQVYVLAGSGRLEYDQIATQALAEPAGSR
jgi:hypothetical protein